jgi:O-antigen ligase
VTAGVIVAVAVLVGLAAGDPVPTWQVPAAVLVGGAVLYAGMRWPFGSLMLMLGSSILLVVVRASGLRSVNLIDILLLPVLVASIFGRARREALAEAPSGPGHDRLRAAEKNFTSSVVIFYACAVLSLIQIVGHSGVGAALDSGLIMIRAFQGLALYPLCMWWLRTPERIASAWSALFAAGVALALVNIVGVLAWDVKRAGMTLFLNNPDAPLSSPNEAGTATLIMGAVLLVRHAVRPHWSNLALGAFMLLVLALTQSRSALLAWGAFGLLTLRWVGPSRLLAGALAIAAILPLLPGTFWERMSRSATVDRGSFEVLSFFQRVFGWQVAWRVFLDHPLTGVGYLGYRFVSHQYNELRLVLGTVENYFYEVLVSMGLVGFGLLILVIVRLFQLGRAVGRAAVPGSLAHHMARYHTPLVIGLLVANMTGDNFMGMVSVAQMAMWTAVLVRSGHAAVAESPST